MKANTKTGSGTTDETLRCQHLLRSSAADVNQKERKKLNAVGWNVE